MALVARLGTDRDRADHFRCSYVLFGIFSVYLLSSIQAVLRVAGQPLLNTLEGWASFLLASEASYPVRPSFPANTCKANLTLELEAERSSDHYDEQSDGTSLPFCLAGSWTMTANGDWLGEKARESWRRFTTLQTPLYPRRRSGHSRHVAMFINSHISFAHCTWQRYGLRCY